MSRHDRPDLPDRLATPQGEDAQRAAKRHPGEDAAGNQAMELAPERQRVPLIRPHEPGQPVRNRTPRAVQSPGQPSQPIAKLMDHSGTVSPMLGQCLSRPVTAQADVLRDYLAHVDDADLAIELPTGAGKTLVGMLASHSSRPHPDGLIWPSVGPDLPELRLVKISPYIGWTCCEPTGLNST